MIVSEPNREGGRARASRMCGRRRQKAARARRPRCERCEWHRRSAAVFCPINKLGMTFDVAKAEQILRERPRPATSLSPRQLPHYVTERDVVLAHVPHVDTLKPGILGVVRRNGRRRKVLIEGYHRGFKARTRRVHFPVYELTEEETAECLC